MSLELEISGMTCERCARHVSDAFVHAGAADAQVDWRAGRATVESNGTSNAELASALDGTGYGVLRIVEPGSPDGAAEGEFEYDLAIVGSGGGAFAAAIAARRRELRVIMVERGVVDVLVLAQLTDDLVLGGDQLSHVHGARIGRDAGEASVCGAVAGLRRGQQRLGRDAADVHARPADHAALNHDHPQLATPRGDRGRERAAA